MQAQFELEQSEKEKEIYKFKNIELDNANKLIESKNKDITDSIKYAKHIQEAILPERNYMKQYLQDFFIFYKPKDIVSGDFYWYDRVNDDKFLIVCADSTGHGVPGAFVSLLAFGALRESFEQNKLKEDVNSIICAANNQFRKTLNNNSNKDSAELGYFFLCLNLDFPCFI